MHLRRAGFGLLVILALAMALAACGGGDDDQPAGAGSAVAVEDTADVGAADVSDEADAPETGDAAAETAEEAVVAVATEAADNLQEVQDARGGGSATLTVGDEIWVFDTVLCAFGEEEIRQEGAEFVLSSLQDGLQLYASIDSFGHSVSLNDIEDFTNPSVALSATTGVARFNGGPEEFVEVDGKAIRAEVILDDETTDELTGVAGVLEAVCP